MMLLFTANIAFLMIAECFAHYETLIISNEPLDVPVSSVKLLEDNARFRNSVIMIYVVREIPTMSESAPRDRYSMDGDDCVDLAITFETIRKGNGVNIVDNSDENAILDLGIWLLTNHEEELAHGDILNDISKEDPNEPNITVILTTCPIGEQRPRGNDHSLIGGGDSFNTVAMQPIYFASFILAVTLSSLV